MTPATRAPHITAYLEERYGPLSATCLRHPDGIDRYLWDADGDRWHQTDPYADMWRLGGQLRTQAWIEDTYGPVSYTCPDCGDEA